MPAAPEIYGLPFDCKYVEVLQELSLLPRDGYEQLPYVDLKEQHLPSPVFATAFSEYASFSYYDLFTLISCSNHYTEGVRLISHLQRQLPNITLIVYNLGITSYRLSKLETYCNVAVREFNFSRYPAYVRNLRTYRWKPLVIAVRHGLVSIC